MSRNDIAIKVHDLHKSFDLPENKITSIKQAFVNIGHTDKKKRQVVLNGIDFEIKKGEFFGIIGRNGSGKSTLLKILAGVYTPDSGAVVVSGSLTPFIELGVGFNPELTGRDNVYMSAALLGHTRKQTSEMYDDIVEFSELKDSMDKKLKNYSSGMQVRLAFSIAIRSRSDVLLIDEVLAVGDENFQRKCYAIFEKFKEEGRTVVFVSHSMAAVNDFCDRALLLDRGEIVMLGKTERVADRYMRLNDDSFNESSEVGTNLDDEGVSSVLGNRGAEINDVEIRNHQDKIAKTIEAGNFFKVLLKVKFHQDAKTPVYGLMFRKNPKENLFGLNSYYSKTKMSPRKKGDIATIEFTGIMPLAPGDYFVSLSVSDQPSLTKYSEMQTLNNFATIRVTGLNNIWGLVANENLVSEIDE